MIITKSFIREILESENPSEDVVEEVWNYVKDFGEIDTEVIWDYYYAIEPEFDGHYDCDNDYYLELGFDPYAGCYTYDC